MKIEIKSVIGSGWSGIINDNGNIISFGGYINNLNELVLSTLFYENKLFDSDVRSVKQFILDNKPVLNRYFVKRHN